MDYDHISVEKKWQARWVEAKLHESEPDEGKPKFFIIFAYPGVSGYLHVGHMRGYTYTDAISRFKRMTGHSVLFPVGTHATGNVSVNFASKVKSGDPAWQEYLRLSAKKDFWDSYNSFREVFDLSKLAIEPETFDGVRDLSPGREVDL